ncbi:MAG: hypothetical protein ACXVV5_26880, partial [Solirubrobacteraceae bacterium]
VIYYRVVASNGFGTTNGEIQSFKTSGSVPTRQSMSAGFGNQQIALTGPSIQACTTRTKTLSVTLRSTAIAKSRRPKLTFLSAGIYLDKGVKHTRRTTKRLRNGRRKTVLIVTYTANAIARHVPVTLAPRLAGLRSGSHTLKVVISYREQVRQHGHLRRLTINKTLSMKFRVC